MFTIPKRLRSYFLFDRRRLGELSRTAARTVITVYRAASGRPDAVPGMVDALQTFGQIIHAHPHIHALVSEGVFLPDGTFLPLPKLATEPFLKLWPVEDCTGGQGGSGGTAPRVAVSGPLNASVRPRPASPQPSGPHSSPPRLWQSPRPPLAPGRPGAQGGTEAFLGPIPPRFRLNSPTRAGMLPPLEKANSYE